MSPLIQICTASSGLCWHPLDPIPIPTPAEKPEGVNRKRSHMETLVSTESWEGKGRQSSGSRPPRFFFLAAKPQGHTGRQTVSCKGNMGIRSLTGSQTWEILSGNFRCPRSRNCIFWSGPSPRRMGTGNHLSG